MALPSGYNVKGLQPKILISDIDGGLQYTYEHDDIAASPTKDFDLYAWNLHLGYGSEMGWLELFIHDYSKNLIDMTDPQIRSKIKNEWLIKFYLGKDSSGLAKWFEGKVRIPGVTRLPKYQSLRIFAVGLGTILGDWDIVMKYIQKKESDGVTPDTTDTTAQVSSLATRLFTDTSLYPIPSFGTPGFTTNGIQTIDHKLPDFIKNYQNIVGCMNELCNASDSTWRIDYEPATPDICMHRRGQSPSGILVTNDIESLKTQNWNVEKLCFLLTRQREFNDSTVDRGYGAYFAIGPYNAELDWDKTTANASTTLYNSDQQFRMTPTKPTIVQLRMAVQRVGTPNADMIVYLVAANADGTPNTSAVYSSTIVKKEQLQLLPTSESYLQVSFEINPARVNPNDYVYVHIPAFGDASNHIVVNRQTGAGVYYKGGAQVGEHKISSYFGQPIAIHYIDINATRKYGKKQLPLAMPQMNYRTALEILNGYTERMSRSRRIYDPIVMSCPEVPVKPGQTLRYIDKFNGMNTKVEIVSVDLGADVYKVKKGGVHEMTLNISEVS